MPSKKTDRGETDSLEAAATEMPPVVDERDFRQKELLNELNAINDPVEAIAFCEAKLSDPTQSPERQFWYAQHMAFRNGSLVKLGEMMSWISYCEVIAERLDNNFLRFHIHVNKADFHLLKREYNQTISECETAEIFLAMDYNPFDDMTIRCQRILLYFWQKRFDEAIKLSLEGLAIAKKCESKGRMSQFLNYVSGLLWASGAVEEALSYMFEGLALAREIGKLTDEAYNLINIGLAYRDLTNFGKARNFLEQALTIIEPSTEITMHILVLLNLIITCLDLEAIADAEIFSQKALQLSILTGDAYLIARAQIHYGDVLSKSKRFEEALEVLLKAQEYFGPWEQQEELYLAGCLSDAYSGLGNYQYAIEYKQKEMELEKKKAGDQLGGQLKYREHLQKESAEKTQEILRLKERELANTASSLAAQTELLGDFRADLRKIVLRPDKYEPEEIIKQVRAKLKELPCEMIDFGKFEAQFATVHPEFRAKLETKYPDLTPQEVKICLLIHVKLQTAAIARLTCLSERTVEDHRGNIRKKMKLDRTDDLGEALSKL